MLNLILFIFELMKFWSISNPESFKFFSRLSMSKLSSLFLLKKKDHKIAHLLEVLLS